MDWHSVRGFHLHSLMKFSQPARKIDLFFQCQFQGKLRFPVVKGFVQGLQAASGIHSASQHHTVICRCDLVPSRVRTLPSPTHSILNCSIYVFLQLPHSLSPTFQVTHYSYVWIYLSGSPSEGLTFPNSPPHPPRTNSFIRDVRGSLRFC